MVELYAVKIQENIDNNMLQLLLHLLPVEKQERIRNYYRIDDQQRSIVADLLSRYLICRKMGLHNRELKITQNEYGKPLLNNDRNIHFNVSHSGDWVICGINDFPVGVDIEKIQPVDFSVAKRFFTEKEYEELLNTDPSERLLYYYHQFTAKESYLKALGLGLRIPLNSFSVTLLDNDISINTDNHKTEVRFVRYNIDPQHVVTSCTFYNDLFDKVTYKELREVIHDPVFND